MYVYVYLCMDARMFLFVSQWSSKTNADEPHLGAMCAVHLFLDFQALALASIRETGVLPIGGRSLGVCSHVCSPRAHVPRAGHMNVPRRLCSNSV